MGEKKPKYNSNFLILNTSNKTTSSKTINNNLYNELFIDKLNTFLESNKYLFSAWMIKNKNNSGIDYNKVHKEHMMDNYFVPLAYLIYSYAYITFQKNNKLKELILNNEYKFHIYNNYVFNYNNPIVKKVNVFIYRFYEQNIGNKNSKSQYFINELIDDSYIEKLVAILNRFIKLFDNEEQNILYEVYAKIEKLKNDIDNLSLANDTIKLFDHLKSITNLTEFSSFYDIYKNINSQIIDIYDIIHKLNIKNVYYLNDIFDINIMNISKGSFTNFYNKIENYVDYSKFIKENITQTKDFLKNLVLKIKEFKYVMIDLYNLLENKRNNQKSETIKGEINNKITYFINEIKQNIINTIENYKIVTKITGSIQTTGKLNINPSKDDKVFGNVGQYITIDGINYKIGTKNGDNYILDPKPNFKDKQTLNVNKNISVQIGKNDNFLSYTTLKNVFNTLISSVEEYLKCNINYINNIRNNITNNIYKNANYDIGKFKNHIIKYYKLLNKNNKNESYYTKTQKRYNDYMANQIKEINSYKLDFKNNGRSNPYKRSDEKTNKDLKDNTKLMNDYKDIYINLQNGNISSSNELDSLIYNYINKFRQQDQNELRSLQRANPRDNGPIIYKLVIIFKSLYDAKKIEVNSLTQLQKNIENKYNSYILKKTINQKCDTIITNTLKELEQIKTIQINDIKTNILNNSSIETSIMNYMDFIQNMLKIFEDKINQMNFQSQKYKINAQLENDGIITLYDKMKEDNKDISYIFEDKTKYFIKDNPKSFLKTIDEIIEKNTNNKLFTDNIKLFFTKYKEYCNDVIKKIKNIMDKISTNELVFINKNGNNNCNKKYFEDLMLKLFSKRNLKLDKIIKNIINHQSKELEGKYIAVFPYTDILFRYLIYLMNISDTLSINTSNNFYIK